MRKLITIASVGLLALSIFGCSKKTTSNTTKKKTNNNTTAVTNTKTNESTTIKTTTKNTTKTTTRKTTTKQKTTTEEKKEIFTEIGYWEFREKLEAAQGTDSYNKMFVTGTIKDGNEIETYDDELYMKASSGKFHGDISKIGIEKVLSNRYLYEYGGDAYYVGDEGSLKMEVDVKISDTVEAKDVFIYNQYGLLESIKTDNITTVESTELYDESVEYDIEMTYSEDDKFGLLHYYLRMKSL
ncbi:MAG: hypothetical protein K6E24_02715 [bacterium]|nr:hypothetical protein [bacterium]